VITAVIIYLSSLLSKVTFYMSEVEQDAGINRFEFLYYMSVLIICALVFLFFLGFPYLDTVVTSQNNKIAGPYVWGQSTQSMLLLGICVSLIWLICYGLCIISRFSEWFLRERYLTNCLSTSDEAGGRREQDLFDGG
jgi:hypothetical protein